MKWGGRGVFWGFEKGWSEMGNGGLKFRLCWGFFGGGVVVEDRSW